MAKRVTILLDDALYDVVLARAGSPRKLSEAANALIAAGLAAEERATDPAAQLTSEVAHLAAEVASLVSTVAGRAGSKPAGGGLGGGTAS